MVSHTAVLVNRAMARPPPNRVSDGGCFSAPSGASVSRGVYIISVSTSSVGSYPVAWLSR